MLHHRASRATTCLGVALLLVAGACAERMPAEPGHGPMLQQARGSGKGGRLLVCPTRELLHASAIIGPEGGAIAAGEHVIQITPGALVEPTRISLTAPAGRHVQLDITAGSGAHFRFEKPVQITISYARCHRPLGMDSSPTVWYVDGRKGRLLELMTGFDDPVRRSIRFETTHLSTYAVAY